MENKKVAHIYLDFNPQTIKYTIRLLFNDNTSVEFDTTKEFFDAFTKYFVGF